MTDTTTSAKRPFKMRRRKRTLKKNDRSPIREVLAFLASRYDGGQIDIRDFAKKLGISYQYASAILNKDEMRLSKAEKIAEAYGHRLILYYPLKVYPLGPPDREVTKRRPAKGNLTGLIRYVEDSYITITRLAKMIGRSQPVIKKAFDTGDIFLSVLQDIADTLRIEITWEWLPANAKCENES